MKKLSNRGKITIVMGLVVAIVGLIVTYFLTRDPIVFKEDNVQVEINDTFDALNNISEVRGGKIKDVKIDTSKVNYHKLGTYTIIYAYQDEAYEVKVEVVDTTKPKFDVVNLDIDLGMKVKPESMATNIVDETITKVTFEEEYDFSKEGTVKVVVLVTDEGGNVTKKKGTVKIVKDEKAPTISGLEPITMVKGTKIDYNLGITVKDNRDPQPKVDIDTSKVNNKKIGKYKVTYTVTDRSGNKTVKEREVKIIEKPAGNDSQTGDKVIYLTFDDGPSANTIKILEVLDRYNVKATFFVTGTNQKYNYVIKQAHDKGHTIALHTYSHSYSTLYASPAAYFEDLNKVGKMVKDLIGFVPRYVRFPGGSSNTISKNYCPGIMTTLTKELINRGYQYYDWNGDSTDATGNNVPVSKLIANATSSKANKINILFHDTGAKRTTVEALPQIIETYKARGYRFEAINDNSFVPHQRVNN